MDELLKSGYHWVVDADLKGYFDSIPQEGLMERIKEKIADGRVLKLVEQMLQAGERVLIFKHRSEVNRVIFISTPHRGSAIASNWIGRIGSALVDLPPALKKLHAPASIDTLSPNDRFVRILNTLPIADYTRY